MTTYDPTSDAIVLRYVGDGRPVDGTPLRDLSEHDVCRIAHRRALAAVAGDVGKPIDPEDPDGGVYERPDPRAPDQALTALVVDELVARGQFEPAKPARKPKEPPTEAPASPAEPEA